MIKASLGLGEVTKYVRATRKAIENGGMSKHINKAGDIVGTTVITKTYESYPTTIRTSTVKTLRDGREITQIRLENGDGSLSSYTIKENKDKNKAPFISIVNKNKNGKVVHKVTRDGDRFSAKIESLKIVDGQPKAVTEIYDTKPSDIKGVINPNQYTQDFFIRTSQDGFFSKI